MFFLKKKKGYGALEYSIIIGLILVISFVVLFSIKGKTGSSEGFLNKAFSAASGEDIGSSVPAPSEPDPIIPVEITFPDGKSVLDFVSDTVTEETIRTYLQTNNVSIVYEGGGEITDFKIENIIKIVNPSGSGPSHSIQFEIVVEEGGGNEQRELIMITGQDLDLLIPDIKEVHLSFNEMGVLMEDGTVRGNGISGISQLKDVKQMALGNGHAVFLLEDGTVKTVGRNNYGQLGDGTRTDRNLPVTVSVPGTANVKKVEAGQGHTLLLMDNGTVVSFGENEDGQLGMITPEDRHPTPTIVPGLTGVKDVFAGLSKKTFFLMNDNTVRVSGHSLGSSGSGMGPVEPGRIFTPVQIPGLSNVKEISPGLGFTFFLLNDQTIRATGENWIGALGNGTLTETKSIITIPTMNGIPIKQVSAGSDYSLLLAVNGDVYVSGSTRGDIDTGYLGMGEMSDMSPYLQYFHNGFSTYGFKSFVKNPHLSNIKQISAGGKSSSYLTEDLVLMGAGSFFGTKTPSVKVIK